MIMIEWERGIDFQLLVFLRLRCFNVGTPRAKDLPARPMAGYFDSYTIRLRKDWEFPLNSPIEEQEKSKTIQNPKLFFPKYNRSTRGESSTY